MQMNLVGVCLRVRVRAADCLARLNRGSITSQRHSSAQRVRRPRTGPNEARCNTQTHTNARYGASEREWGRNSDRFYFMISICLVFDLLCSWTSVRCQIRAIIVYSEFDLCCFEWCIWKRVELWLLCLVPLMDLLSCSQPDISILWRLTLKLICLFKSTFYTCGKTESRWWRHLHYWDVSLRSTITAFKCYGKYATGYVFCFF